MNHCTRMFSALVLLSCVCVTARADFYVATDGNDAWSGTIAQPSADRTDGPFASLEAARDAARALREKQGASPKAMVVNILPGTYEFGDTFALSKEDSGTPSAPVTYKGPGNDAVRIVGGKVIAADLFGPVADAAGEVLDADARPHVLQADLAAAGVTDCGTVPNVFRGAPLLMELFFNDERMTVARWPNDDWVVVPEIVDRGSVPRDGEKDNRPGIIAYAGDRPARWNVERGVWLDGYWCYDWYNEAIKVGAIDTEAKHITFVGAHNYGFGGKPNRRYYAVNVFEELDAPGEYYVDRGTSTLYFWPPAPIESGRVVVSALTKPLIALSDVSNVTIQGLTLECCRGTALTVSEGSDCLVAACHVRNTGQGAISVRGGVAHVVQSCDIHDTGTSGIELSGGDRPTLTPAHHGAVNNHIYRFGRRQRTYASGIQIGGVGQYVAHNLLHDAPHQAIGLSGNDHVVELNEVHHVILETDDCGAFYMGRNPSHRGTVIRHNFWHHLGAPLGHGNNAVYFDDGDGGQTVFGNVFLRCGEPGRSNMGAVFCHGGHDNLIENNIFIECKRAIGASPWNDKRWKDYVNADLWQTRLLKEVDITKPPYVTRYPQLEGFMTPSAEPRMNRAVRNVAVMCYAFIKGNYTDEDNVIIDADPGFVDPNKGDFTLRPNSPVFKLIPSFKPIPFREIGLVPDEFRPKLQESDWPYEPLGRSYQPRL